MEEHTRHRVYSKKTEKVLFDYSFIMLINLINVGQLHVFNFVVVVRAFYL